MRRIGILCLLLTLAGCDIFQPPLQGTPTVNSVIPSNSTTNVSVGASVIADLSLPNGGINPTTVDTNSSVRLVNTATGEAASATVNVLNDTKKLVLTPSPRLEYSTTYRFEMTSGVSDASGATFTDYSSTFTTVSADVPSVTGSRPSDGAIDVPLTGGISADINTNLGIDASTLTSDSVYLETVDGNRVLANAPATSGGGDAITLTPARSFTPGTSYRFTVTSAVHDATGASFVPYTITFTTTGTENSGGPTNIASIKQPVTNGTRYSSLAFGPDGNLYALTILGEIQRFPVAADGSLGNPTKITSLQQAEGEPRLTIGLAFDPTSTSTNPVAWVTNTYIDVNNFDGSVGNGIVAPWAGKLTKLSGPNLENVQDVVIGLPRSSKDHVTNSVAFNPAEPGVVYFVQGSNTAMGAPDSAWKYQEERALSGAVLRLDTNLLSGSLPLDVQTEGGANYNPFTPGAPLTVYASGTRNSYDLVWTSKGDLYVPANGSAANGNAPRYDPIPGTCDRRIDGKPYTGPRISDPGALNNYSSDRTDGWKITETLQDYLFKIEKGGYYGTPNPKRCEWILNGGSVGFPGFPSTQRPEYPAGTSYDPNYRGPAGDFGTNISPNGAIEYTGNAFPNLKGKLLVVRYNRFDDVVAVTLGGDGKATSIDSIIQTPGDVIDPIDIAQSPTTGNLYVSWYDQQGGQSPAKAGITLLRPK